MSSPVRGVETNEYSRFIDHTLASPWETFISDVEKVLRSLNKSTVSSAANLKHIVEYVGNEFDIQLMNVNEDPLIDRDGILTLLSSTNQSEIITATYAGGNATENVTKMTIISAISIAVKSIPDLRYPVLISTDAFGNEMMDWIGYRPIYSTPDGPDEKQKQDWYKYESSTLARMSTKHRLFFFDGIRRLYQQRVKSLPFAIADESRLLEQFTSQITHTYQFELKQWLQSSGMAISNHVQQPPQIILSPSFDELLRLLLLRKVTFQKLVLTGIRVSISFRERVPRGLIDNESYSTLLPSRQPPNRWTLSPVWKPLDLIHPFPEEATVQLPWKSLCLRRLLAFLLLSTFSRRDQQYSNRRNRSQSSTEETSFPPPPIPLSSPNMSSSTSQSQQQQMEFSFEGTVKAKDLLAGLQLEELTALAEKLSPLSQRVLAAALHQSSSSAIPTPQPVNNNAPNNSVNNTNNPQGRKRSRSTSTRRSSSSLSSSISMSRAQDEAEERQDKYLQPVLRHLFYTPTAVNQAVEHESESSKSFSMMNNTTGNKLSFVSLGGSEDEATSSGVAAWIERLSIISGLLPLRATTIVRLWQACLRELHDHFDNGSPVYLFAEYEELDSKEQELDNENKGREGGGSIPQPLHNQLLWEDLIYWKQRDGIHVTLPDQQQGLLVQKLQVLHFCTVMKNESQVFEADTTFKAQYQTFAENFNWPLLQRRVPLTSDVIALQKRIQQKFLDDASRTLREQPLLRYQGLLPVLASDVAAFRQANPTLDLPTFCEWYGLNKVSLEGEISGLKEEILPQVEELWQQLDQSDSDVMEQKALFNAEKEANKAMADLERMSLSSFAMELVFHACKLILRLLQTSAKELTNEILDAKLRELKGKIELLKPPKLPIKGEALANHLPGLCLQVDVVAEEIFAIEGLIYMLLQLRPVQQGLIPSSSQQQWLESEEIVNAWLKDHGSGKEGGSYRLQREEQVTALLKQMKGLSRSSALSAGGKSAASTVTVAGDVVSGSIQNHEWLSYDGRELGLPNEKTFILTSSRNSHHHSSNSHQQSRSHHHSRSGGTTGLSSPLMSDAMTAGSSYVSRVTSPSPGGLMDGSASPLATRLDMTESDLKDVREKESKWKENEDCALRLTARASGSQLQVLWELFDT